MTRWEFVARVLVVFVAACANGSDPVPPRVGGAAEVHLRGVKRLTTKGANAEAYFSPDGRRLIFQATRPPFECDQIFIMDLDGGGLELVSTGRGRCTCAWFFPDGEHVLYSSTHHHGAECPPTPPRSKDFKKYVWPLHATYDIFRARIDGSELQPLTEQKGYDAEATIAPDGSRILFTSTRDGDIEIYSMNLDGSDVRRLTRSVGYDGGAVYSFDSRLVVFRADELADPQEIAEYRELLAQNLVNPTRVEIFVMNPDGSGRRQLTRNGMANFAPTFHPDGERIVFSSNLGSADGRTFHLYGIRTDGTGLEPITTEGTFNSFPAFSPDGKKLVFVSNRFVEEGFRAYDICVADWVD